MVKNIIRMLGQFWFKVGPASEKVAQHQPNIGLMYHVVSASRYFHVNSASFLSPASNYTGSSACFNPESVLNIVILKQRQT